MTRTFAAIGLAAAACLALSSCASGDTSNAGSGGEGGSGDGLTIAVVTPYLGNATTKEVIDLFKEEGKTRGWDVSVEDTAGDMNKLNSAFQNAAAQKPDAIVLGMGDPTQISLGLKAAADAEVPVFAIDAAEADGILANVTSDNQDLGEQSANALIEAIGGDGSIVMLTHDPHPGVKARAEGAREVFTKAGITILEEKHIEVPGPVDNARKAVQDIVSAQGDKLNGIWGGWDEPALGATQALNAANVTDVPVVGVDGQDFAIAEIDKGGPFVATVKQNWPEIAKKVADLIADNAKGTKPEQTQFELPGTLYTKK
ncbi:sugar ABC transporter substrate-binding protein [Leucobacter luti]|uniref:sugar ABC transporter substrate-binding protein n=1 Tax=Leucobacter luti TaxID=340320 RepID=UPI003D02B532